MSEAVEVHEAHATGAQAGRHEQTRLAITEADATDRLLLLCRLAHVARHAAASHRAVSIGTTRACRRLGRWRRLLPSCLMYSMASGGGVRLRLPLPFPLAPAEARREIAHEGDMEPEPPARRVLQPARRAFGLARHHL